MVTHQRDVLILIGHEKKSPIIQDHTVYMLHTKNMVKVIMVIEIPVKTVIKRKEILQSRNNMFKTNAVPCHSSDSHRSHPCTKG